MVIYNLKLNSSFLYKLFFFLLISASIVLFSISIYKIYHSIKDDDTILVKDLENVNSSSEISSKNYTNILKQVHDNVEEYIGKEITFTGYIYRIDGIEDNQFILARNMIINEASQSIVVGFLSEYNDISNFKDFTWVKVTGTIEKGYLNGDIPVLKTKSINKVKKPKDEFVYPPDDEYIPTSSIY